MWLQAGWSLNLAPSLEELIKRLRVGDSLQRGWPALFFLAMRACAAGDGNSQARRCAPGRVGSVPVNFDQASGTLGGKTNETRPLHAWHQAM